jgi:hypothetical protein
MLPLLLLGASLGQTAPGAVEAVSRCRSITDGAERLACFDRTVDALSEALETRELQVVDRETVEKTRRSLFGFSVKTAPILQDDAARGVEEVKEFNGTIEQVRASAYGRFELTLNGGAVWTTTEPLPRDPRSGQTVTIKKGALNSYIIKIDGGRSVRCRRIG